MTTVSAPNPTTPAEAKSLAARMKARWWPSIMVFGNMCRGCGDRTHLKTDCKLVKPDTCCEYCKLKGSHTATVCPTLHGLCKHCFRRGHFVSCEGFDEKHWYKCKPLGFQSKEEDYQLQVIPRAVKLQIFKVFGKDLPKVFAQLPTYVKEDMTKEERIEHGIPPNAQPLPKVNTIKKLGGVAATKGLTQKTATPTKGTNKAVNATPTAIVKTTPAVKGAKQAVKAPPAAAIKSTPTVATSTKSFAQAFKAPSTTMVKPTPTVATSTKTSAQVVNLTSTAMVKPTPTAIATTTKSMTQAVNLTASTIANITSALITKPAIGTAQAISATTAKTNPTTSTTQAITTPTTITIPTPSQNTRWSNSSTITPSQHAAGVNSTSSNPARVPFLEPCVIPVTWLEYLSLDSSVCKQCAGKSHGASKKCPNMTSYQLCEYCGNLNHLVYACPALHKLCKACWRRGHETGKCAKFDPELWLRCKAKGVQSREQDAQVDVVGIKQRAVDLFGDRLAEVFWQLPLFIRERFSPDERVPLGVCAEVDSGARDSNAHPELELGDRCACCAGSGHAAPTCPLKRNNNNGSCDLVCEYCGRRRHHAVAACAMLHLLCPLCWRRGHRVGRCDTLDEEKWHNLKYKAFGSRNCKFSLYVDPSTLNEKMCLSQEKLRRILNKIPDTTSSPLNAPMEVAPPLAPPPSGPTSNVSPTPAPSTAAQTTCPSIPVSELPKPLVPTPSQPQQPSKPRVPGVASPGRPTNTRGLLPIPGHGRLPFPGPGRLPFPGPGFFPFPGPGFFPFPGPGQPLPVMMLPFRHAQPLFPPAATRPKKSKSKPTVSSPATTPMPSSPNQQPATPSAPQPLMSLPNKQQMIDSNRSLLFPSQDQEPRTPSQEPEAIPPANPKQQVTLDHVTAVTGPPLTVFPAYSGPPAQVAHVPAPSAVQNAPVGQHGPSATSGPALKPPQAAPQPAPVATGSSAKETDRRQLKRKAEEHSEAPRFVLPKPIPSLNDQ